MLAPFSLLVYYYYTASKSKKSKKKAKKSKTSKKLYMPKKGDLVWVDDYMGDGSKSIQGKYSKRRRSNVAVIIIRVIFISLFLFYCLLFDHIFQTNPNSDTNCSKLFSLLQLTTTLLLRRFFIFLQLQWVL